MAKVKMPTKCTPGQERVKQKRAGEDGGESPTWALWLDTACVESGTAIAKGPQHNGCIVPDSTQDVGLVIVKVGGSTLI